MTSEELKKKIMEVIDNSVDAWATRDKRGRIHVHIEKIADALISAGLTFEPIVIRTVEPSDECEKKIHEILKEEEAIIEEITHRAFVAERITIILSKWLADKTRKNYPYQAWLEAAQKQAEKELAEEGKDENN